MNDWLLRALHMADDDDGKGGDGDGGDGGGKGGGGEDHRGGGDGDGKGQQGGDGDKGGDKKVEMSQSDLDAMMASRADRATKAALGTAATAAGFDTVEAFTEAAKRDTERSDADKSDIERAKEAQAAAERIAASNADDLKVERVGAAFQLEALKANIPAARIGDALALADLVDVNVDDKGVVQGVEAAVKKLVADKPWVMGGDVKGNGTGADGGARGSGSGDGTVSPAVLDMGTKLGITGADAGERIALAATSVDTPTNKTYIDSMRDRMAEGAAKKANARDAAAAARQQ